MTIERRFALAAIATGVGALAAYAGLILTATGQRLENMALRGARQEFDGLRQESIVELHETSLLGFALAIGLVVLIALLRRKPRLALAAALLMGVSVVIAEVAKRLLPRPELIDAPLNWLSNSFPSGHVTIAVAIGIGAVIVAPYAFRWLVAIVAALYSAGIGMDVATAGWHRLSGVIGATLLVIAVAVVTIYVLARMGRVHPFGQRRLIGALVASVVLGALALGFGGIGAVFGFGRLLPLPAAPTPDDQLLAYTSTLLVATGVIAAAYLAFLWLIRPYAIDEDAETDDRASLDPVNS